MHLGQLLNEPPPILDVASGAVIGDRAEVHRRGVEPVAEELGRHRRCRRRWRIPCDDAGRRDTAGRACDRWLRMRREGTSRQRPHARHHLVLSWILDLAVIAIIGVPQNPKLAIGSRRPNVSVVVSDVSIPINFVSRHHRHLVAFHLPRPRPACGVLHLMAERQPYSARAVAIQPWTLQRRLFRFEHRCGRIGGRFPNQILDSFLDELESSQGAELSNQKERAEPGFREGRFTTWDEVKRQNGL